MRRRTKSEQREYIPGRARQLARSGEFSGWWEIERHLVSEEHCPEARHSLDREDFRDELDRLCEEAQSRLPREHSDDD